MTERRKNFDGRRRIEQLEQRYSRITHLLVGGMAGLSVALVIGFIDQGRINDRIQQSRVSAIERLCNQRNADHTAIADFITHVAPRLRRRAAQDFPVTGDCKGYARTLAQADN